MEDTFIRFGMFMSIAGGIGSWLRWAVIPVVMAFEAGRLTERIASARKAPGRGGVGLPEGEGWPLGGGGRPWPEGREA